MCWKEKKYLFTDDMIQQVVNPKESTGKFLERKGELSKEGGQRVV